MGTLTKTGMDYPYGALFPKIYKPHEEAIWAEPLARLRGNVDGGTLDQDLALLLPFLKDLFEKLSVMGPEFRLAEREVLRLWQRAEDYRIARTR